MINVKRIYIILLLLIICNNLIITLSQETESSQKNNNNKNNNDNIIESNNNNNNNNNNDKSISSTEEKNKQFEHLKNIEINQHPLNDLLKEPLEFKQETQQQQQQQQKSEIDNKNNINNSNNNNNNNDNDIGNNDDQLEIQINEISEEYENEKEDIKQIELKIDRDIICSTDLSEDQHKEVIDKVLKSYFDNISPNSIEYSIIQNQFSQYIKNNICNNYQKPIDQINLNNNKNEDNNNNNNIKPKENTTPSPPNDKESTIESNQDNKDSSSSSSSSSSSADNTVASSGITTTTTKKPKKPIEWPPESNYELDYSKILELTDNNFERVIKENKFVYVLFYAPWCSRSQALMIEFEEAHRLVQSLGLKVVFAKANCHKYPTIRDKQSIGGYPVMELFRRNGGNIIPRGSSSQPASMVSFLCRYTLPATVYIDDLEKYQNFSKYVPYGLIGLFPNSTHEGAIVYQKLSKKLSYKFPMAFANDTKVIQDLTTLLNLSSDSNPFNEGIILIKPIQKSYILFNIEYKISTILRWLSVNYSPIVNELTPDSTHRIISNKIKQSFLLFLDLNNSTTSLALNDRPFSKELETLLQVANNFNEFINLYYVDGISFRDFGDRLGVTHLPMMVIIDFDSEEFFLSNNKIDEPFTADLISTFLNDFLDKKLLPFKYSEKLTDSINNRIDSDPTLITTNEGISKIVFNNFESVVLESNKNSLVYFTAPWCGFCKTMDVYYKEAAKILSKKYGDSLQILIYDLEKNSIPNSMKQHIQAYPYISLFLENSNPIAYNLTRSLDSILDFVNFNLDNQKQQQQQQENENQQQQQQNKDTTTTKEKEEEKEHQKLKDQSIPLEFQLHSLDDAEKETI